jgi:hypothetical protein
MTDDVSLLAVGAFTMGVGGVVLLAITWRSVRLVFAVPGAIRWVALGGLGVFVYPLAFYSGMDLVGVAVGNSIALGSGPLFAGVIEGFATRKRPTLVWGVALGVAIVGLVVVAMAVQSLITTLRSLRTTVEDLRVETLSAVAELRATVALANGEIERVDSLLDTAETVGARVEATSRLAWLVMRNPLVKLASVSVATDRTARRLSRVDGQVEVTEPFALDEGVGGARRKGRGVRTGTSRRERRAG